VPKKVDHGRRRDEISRAVVAVAAERGLPAVSLRTVAQQAGVTSGMVQHYFESRDAMVDYAMSAASSRFESRMTQAVERLGDEPGARLLVWTLLSSLVPTDEEQLADARVALDFMASAATTPSAARRLEVDNARLRDYLAHQLRSAQHAGELAQDRDPELAATALFALAEGLSVHVISGGLDAADALAALESTLTAFFV